MSLVHDYALPREEVYAKISVDNPEEELLARALARKRLLHFTSYTFPTYTIDPLQLVLGGALEACLNNDVHRLMVFAPPQHGKSELVSVRFPAFWCAKRPDDPVIICSYGAALAGEKVSSVRQVIESNPYKALFPDISISKRTRGNGYWRIDGHRGTVISAGVGGPITGYGGMLGIIDDPFKNYEEAASITIRERVWNWWRSTFRTRIWDKGVIILVMTRWHEDDLAGRLLQDQGDKWAVIRLPAIAEDQKTWDENCTYLNIPDQIGLGDPACRQPGEPLCPSRYPIETLTDLRADSGPISWAAQYCGVPRMPEGNLIKRSWFKVIQPEEVPFLVALVRYWDKAATEEGGKRTAGVLMGIDATFRFYIVDVTKGQWSTYKREEIIHKTAETDRINWGSRVTTYMEQEPGSGGLDSMQSTFGTLAGYSVGRDKVGQSKLARLDPFMGQAEAGRVAVVKGTWNWDWFDEMTAIPNGTYWDQADATGGALNMLGKRGWTRGMKK